MSTLTIPDSWKFKSPRHSKKWYETQRILRFGREHTKKKFKRKLKKMGLALCPNCHGEGKIKKKIKNLNGIRTRRVFCIRCKSKGFIDWVDRVVGVSFK